MYYIYLLDINSSGVADTTSPSGLAFTDILARLAQAGLLLAGQIDRDSQPLKPLKLFGGIDQQFL